MTRIAPMSLEELPEDMRSAMEFAEKLMGFAPNDVLAMARWPEFLLAVKALVDVVYSPGELDPQLKRMIGTVVSGSAGCTYCQAHTAHGAVELVGADPQKVADVWEYATNPAFSDAEKAALDLAAAAGVQPNETTDAHFVVLREHFSSRQIMEIMGVISLFGLLNRWNDTLATQLEDKPMKYSSLSA